MGLSNDLISKKTRGIHAHHLHCIYLFGNSHTSDLRRNVRAHLTGQDQSHHSRAELQDEAFPHHIAYIHLVDDRILQVRCGLDDKHSTDEKGNHSHQKDR